MADLLRKLGADTGISGTAIYLPEIGKGLQKQMPRQSLGSQYNINLLSLAVSFVVIVGLELLLWFILLVDLFLEASQRFP